MKRAYRSVYSQLSTYVENDMHYKIITSHFTRSHFVDHIINETEYRIAAPLYAIIDMASDEALVRDEQRS